MTLFLPVSHAAHFHSASFSSSTVLLHSLGMHPRSVCILWRRFDGFVFWRASFRVSLCHFVKDFDFLSVLFSFLRIFSVVFLIFLSSLNAMKWLYNMSLRIMHLVQRRKGGNEKECYHFQNGLSMSFLFWCGGGLQFFPLEWVSIHTLQMMRLPAFLQTNIRCGNSKMKSAVSSFLPEENFIWLTFSLFVSKINSLFWYYYRLWNYTLYSLVWQQDRQLGLFRVVISLSFIFYFTFVKMNVIAEACTSLAFLSDIFLTRAQSFYFTLGC